ncbi:MAG: transcription elongation factor subunit Spt4 [Nitrososphaerota archaeon]
MSDRARACRNCRRIVLGPTCDVCGSSDLAVNFSGLLIILDPEKSVIAKELGITKPGHYAVKID